jgi:DNA-binding transcriptional regulator YdaS (Cro superfamily)
MANLSISLPDSVLAAALAEAMNQGTTLEAFIERAISSGVSRTALTPRLPANPEAILQEAVNVAKSKSKGDKFLLKDLCDDQSWTSMTTGERKVFGKRFRTAIEGSKTAKHVDKTSSNQAIYERL